MHVRPNFRTKNALKRAVKAGKIVTTFEPGPFRFAGPKEGIVAVKGPYPEPYHWQARVIVEDEKVIKVK